ncbi:MAG: SlyX protein [Yoonia sp.]|jgi:SlyX protein
MRKMSKQAMTNESIEQALESLEVKLAYQEDTIEMLNQTVIQQQDKINSVVQLLGKLDEKIKSMPASDSPINDQEELPPHY